MLCLVKTAFSLNKWFESYGVKNFTQKIGILTGSRERPVGRKVIDEFGEGDCVGYCACERQELRVLLDR